MHKKSTLDPRPKVGLIIQMYSITVQKIRFIISKAPMFPRNYAWKGFQNYFQILS